MRRTSLTGQLTRSLALATGLAVVPRGSIATLGAQQPAPTFARSDTLRLETLQSGALQRDPRTRQLGLLDSATSLRLENIGAERLPQFSLSANAQHQSDVTMVSLGVPGVSPPRPPKDRWEAILGAQQLLYDAGSLGVRRAVERARLAESREGVRVAQYRLRAEVNTAFFNAYLLQERRAEIAAAITDLEARLAVVRSRVREGAALPGDTAAIVSEMLRASQSEEEVASGRRAAIAVLEKLVGAGLDTSALLALPALDEHVARVMAEGESLAVRGRPEFAQLAQSRARLGREAELLDAERRPRVVAFGQAGYGKPGLDQFRTRPDQFWIAGVRMEWKPWTWGTTARQQEALRIQQRVVETEEAALAVSLERSVQGDIEDIRRLKRTMESDDRIIALREQVERQARAQLDEGAITVADYVQTRTDVLEARLAKQRHRVELAHVEARFLNTVGRP